jgi:hypothetical protein
MPTAEYETRKDSVLAWKKTQKLGRFDPDAPSIEEQKILASAREVEERGMLHSVPCASTCTFPRIPRLVANKHQCWCTNKPHTCLLCHPSMDRHASDGLHIDGLYQHPNGFFVVSRVRGNTTCHSVHLFKPGRSVHHEEQEVPPSQH